MRHDMLAKSPHTIVVDLPERCGTGWVATPTLDIRLLGTIRPPFVALQAEHQADHHDSIRDQELRIGQRIP